MNELLIPNEVKEAVERDLKDLLSGTATIEKIVNNDQLANANTLLKQVKATFERISEKEEDLYRPHKENCDSVRAYFKEPKVQINKVETNLKTVIGSYLALKQQEQIEAQRKADEETRKQRERLEREANEKRRKEEEARAEADRLAQEAARAEGEERERLEKESARKQAEANRAAEAATIKESIAQTVVAPIVQAAPVAKGFSTQFSYTVEVENLPVFAKWAVQEQKFHLLQPVTKTLDKLAEIERENLRIPGCRIKKEPIYKSKK